MTNFLSIRSRQCTVYLLKGTYTSVAQGDEPGFQVDASISSWFDSENGTVKSTMDTRSKATLNGGEEGPQTIETRIQSNTELISVR